MRPTNAKTIVKALAGSYTLLNATIYRTGSSTPISVDVDWVGILTYTTWDYMSATMSATDPEVRPLSVGWPPKTNDSTSDWALVGRNSFSYAGRFGVKPGSSKTQGQVVHGPMEVASVPSFAGTTETRNYTVEKRGGLTYLAWHVALDDVGDLRADVYWRRIE